MLGIGAQETVGKETAAAWSSERAEEEFTRLKDIRHRTLGSLTVETPDPEFNSTINVQLVQLSD